LFSAKFELESLIEIEGNLSREKAEPACRKREHSPLVGECAEIGSEINGSRSVGARREAGTESTEKCDA
jgi:hypothetical protein